MEKKCDSINYILSDADTPADFVEAVESATHRQWNVIEHIVPMSKAKIRRVLGFYLTPLKFLLCHTKAKNILAWQQFFGILTAFYNRYLFHRRLSISIMTFIYHPKAGIAGKIFYRLVNSAITSKCVKIIIVFAENEVEHYERLFPKAKGKFHFVKLGIPVDDHDYRDEALASQNYYFSTGVSNRDYDFIIDVFAGLDSRLKIACPGIKQPEARNVEVLSNCFMDDMKRHLYNCKGVVIPLKNLNISSGQLVFIQSMQFGKPIVITDSGSTRSYLQNGVDAIILPNEVNAWRDAINRLNTDQTLYTSMATNNRLRGRSDFSISGLGKNIGSLISTSLSK